MTDDKITGEHHIGRRMSSHAPFYFLKLTFLAFTVLLSGCFPWVYKLDVQQGNLVKPEMLSKLEPGMTKRQVRYIMGTPVLQSNDAQDRQRWDYYYSLEQRDVVTSQYLVSVFFDVNGIYQYYSGHLPAEIESGTTEAAPEREPDPVEPVKSIKISTKT